VSDQDALLEVAVSAARMAGGLLLERVRRGAERGISSKSTPTDLVSEADLASEQAIRELLAERRPQDGFVGEEGDHAEGASGLEWVVDPLDGTVNFLYGIPQWCVSVAVRDGNGALAGAIYDASRNELFTATRDGHPRLIGPAGVSELRGRLAEPAAADADADTLAGAMVATGFAYDARVRAAQRGARSRLDRRRAL
jgi:myo-inositol-1(or 4)-monophosphatase